MSGNSFTTATQGRQLRITLTDFAGRSTSLSDSIHNWRQLGPPGQKAKNRILLLGIGTGTANPPFIPEDAEVYWIEEPKTLAALKEDPRFSLETRLAVWNQIPPDSIPALAQTCQPWHYKPGLRLAPDFWGPVLAAAEVSALESAPHVSDRKSVWLPGSSNQLLHQELKSALNELGYFEIHEGISANVDAKSLMDIWKNQRPHLAVSVNFRGLDSEGQVFHILQELEVPLFIWLVDNPWHILSGIRFPWWRKANIFVTDSSFIKSMYENGAKNVWGLPLAVAPHMWQKNILDRPTFPPLFIGRSTFPNRQSFFRGITIPQEIYRTAEEKKADWHWWNKALAQPLWPNFAGRAPGLGAEICSTANRSIWIKAALPHGLEIIGDNAWHDHLPEAPLHPPVDYYGSLPVLYNKSQAILNVTSMLLPTSLNQRHFDVWAAGGLLLSDATPGLDIFPQEITGPMTLHHPGDFGPRLAYFKKNPNARADLTALWQEKLKTGHSYKDRLEFMLTRIATS